MRYFYLFLLMLLTSCNKSALTTDTVEYLTTTIQYKHINGVDRNLLSLDIYYNNNTNTKKPIVVYVHGGGWCLGDKANKIENKVNLFLSLNYVFVSINYRLSPFPYEPSNPDRIKYPDHNIDVADALLWIYNNIEKYGGNKNKIALLGHSAGAHLVALTGTNKSFLKRVGLNPSIIKGVMVIDTEGYDINEQITNGDTPNMYINAFGTDTILNIEASPIYNVTAGKTYPKFFIAKRGDEKRIGYADDFINVLEENGVSVSQIDGSIYTHSEINEAIGKPNETIITPPLIDFLKTVFQ